MTGKKKGGDRRIEAIMGLCACYLAFRGESPDDIAARAMRAAGSVRTLLDRLDALGEQTVRRAMNCRAPAAPCDCLYCEEKARDARSTEKPS